MESTTIGAIINAIPLAFIAWLFVSLNKRLDRLDAKVEKLTTDLTARIDNVQVTMTARIDRLYELLSAKQ